MQKNTKTIFNSLFLVAILSLSINALAVWTPPSQAPTGGNVEPPVNVGAASQQKSGGLIVGGIRSLGVSLLDGNVGIGNLVPSQKLDVTGNIRFSGALMPNGSAGNASNILISGGAGVAPSWSTLAAAGGLTNPMDSIGDMIYGGVSGVPTKLDSGTSGYVLMSNGAAAPSWATLTGAGSIFGSQAVNTFFAAPSGAAGTPTFRLITTADLPSSIPVSKLAPSATNGHVLTTSGGVTTWAAPSGGVTDGDKGDITVTASGATWTIDNNAVNNPKILDNAVTNSKIIANAVTTDKIAPSATNGQVLTTSGGITTWATPTSSGITSLNGLTSSIQTFTNDSNVTISSAGSVHTLGWSGTLPVSRGGTSLSAIAAGSVWVANSANTITTVTPGLGQSVRRNSSTGNWEAYTPGAGLPAGTSGQTIRYDATNTAVANSILYNNGTNVGINTTAPGARLSVLGNLNIGTSYATVAGQADGAIIQGTVGIGTSSPSGTGIKLHVSGVGGTNVNGIRISHPTQAKDWDLLIGGSVNSFAGGFAIADAGTARFVVDTTGNVGVGETTPASLFTVGTGDLFQVNSSGDIVKIKNIAYTWPSAQGTSGQVLTNNGTGGLSWTTISGGGSMGGSGTINYIPKFTAANSIGDSTIMQESGTNDIGIATATPGSKLSVLGNASIGTTYSQSAAPANGLLIEGNVGIGNSSPSEKLDVTGNVRFSGALMPNNLPGVAGLVLTSQGAGVAPTWTGVFPYVAGGVGYTIRGTGATTWTADTNIYNNGSVVGIGTTTPGQKLSVAGSFGIREGGASPTFYTAFTGGDQTANITYTLPTTGATTTGQVLSSTNTGVLSWTTVSGMTNPMTTAGDLIYANASGTPANPVRLGVGTAGQVLTVSSVTGLPYWSNPGTGADNMGNHIATDNIRPSSAAGFDLGLTGTPWKNLYIAGSSTTPGTNRFLITGTATGARTITLPDISDTLVGKATIDTLTNKTLSAANNIIDADTAISLAANGSNCAAGSYPLGVDASGNAEGCTVAGGGGGVTSVTAAADNTLIISPNTGAVIAALNLGKANSWTATQTFTNATSAASFTGPTTFSGQLNLSSNFSQTGTGTFSTGSGNVTLNGNTTLGAGDTLTLSGLTSGAVTLQATAATTSHTLTLPSTQGAANSVLTNNGSGGLSWTVPSGGGGSTTLDAIGDAVATGSVSAGTFGQTWSWGNFVINGLALSGSSTAANSGAGDTQKLFSVALSGANTNSSQETYASYFTNSHTGTSSTNIAGYFSATSGTNNYSIFATGTGTGLVTGLRINHGTEGSSWDLAIGGASNSFPGGFVIADTGAAKLVINSSGNVGIGTTSIGSLLSLGGNIAVGSGYSGTFAPTNGMIVQGYVGIGTSVPGANLEVSQSTTGPGNVTNTAGSTSLTGSGTNFTSTFRIGDTITVSGESARTISGITSDTSLTVSTAFTSAHSATTYTLTGGTKFAVNGNSNIEMAGNARIYLGANRFIHTYSPAGTTDENLFMGVNAGILGGTSGSFNTGIGNYSLNSLTTGQTNVALGSSALSAVSSGSGNVGVGDHAIAGGTSGYGTGNMVTVANTTGSGITAIGNIAGVTVNGLTNATAIGNGAGVDASNKVRIGNTGVTVIQGQVNFTAGSDIRFKKEIQNSDLGLDFILKLRPVSYKLKVEGDKDGRSYGFIAQEVEAALEGRNTRMIDTQNGPDKLKFMRYDDLIAPMTKAIQEQQAQIEALKKEIELLKKK